MRWWNRKFKACSFAVKKSPPRRHKMSFQRRYDILRYRTTLKRRCVSTGLFVALYLFTNLCFARTFCLSIIRKHCIKKRLCHRCFPVDFENFCKLYYRKPPDGCFWNYYWQQPKKFSPEWKTHIISPVEVWLGSKRAPAQGLILKNKIKNIENKAMIKF